MMITLYGGKTLLIFRELCKDEACPSTVDLPGHKPDGHKPSATKLKAWHNKQLPLKQALLLVFRTMRTEINWLYFGVIMP